MSAFHKAFTHLLKHEGGFDATPSDPGNWTGGRVGVGALRGTKFGISAGAYPDVDIAALTQDTAADIYRRDYWDRVSADSLPADVAFLVFDAAVNCGVSRAIRWLQMAAGVAADGIIGPMTTSAVASANTQALGAEFLARRLMFMAALPGWALFGLGWARRLCALPFESLATTES